MRRAPVWFTHGKAREKIHGWWPWLAGLALGGMYWYQPEPFERARVGALYAVRRPVLQGSQWLEVRDVDPESMALDLPPDQIFGPLPLAKQVKFVMQALNEDNELGDNYVTRLVIDHMDLSLDPPFLGSAFVEAGGGDIMRFAVSDFLDTRPNAKHKFFDADRFLRFITICANHPELAKELVEKHDGVNLMFKAMREASNEYARVLGMRAVTLFAFQQDRDGEIEKAIVDNGHLDTMIKYYRQSTGDPTDTRFLTLLMSSTLRLFPNEAYPQAVNANLVKATVNNLNISRYKGVTQHIRILHDMERARAAVYGGGANGQSTQGSSPSTGANAGQKSGGSWWSRLFSSSSSSKKPSKKTAPAATGSDSAEDPAGGEEDVEVAADGTIDGLKDLRGAAASRKKSGVQPVRWESHREDPNELPSIPPPRDPKAPVSQLLFEGDFAPVALGVCDVFPEYFEASRELVHLLNGVRQTGMLSPFELFELRFFTVATKLFNRHGLDADFEEHGVAAALVDMGRWIMNDPECKPYLDPKCKATNSEIKTAIKSFQDHVDARDKRIAEGASLRQRAIPVPVAV